MREGRETCGEEGDGGHGGGESEDTGQEADAGRSGEEADVAGHGRGGGAGSGSHFGVAGSGCEENWHRVREAETYEQEADDAGDAVIHCDGEQHAEGCRNAAVAEGGDGAKAGVDGVTTEAGQGHGDGISGEAHGGGGGGESALFVEEDGRPIGHHTFTKEGEEAEQADLGEEGSRNAEGSALGLLCGCDCGCTGFGDEGDAGGQHHTPTEEADQGEHEDDGGEHGLDGHALAEEESAEQGTDEPADAPERLKGGEDGFLKVTLDLDGVCVDGNVEGSLASTEGSGAEGKHPDFTGQGDHGESAEIKNDANDGGEATAVTGDAGTGEGHGDQRTENQAEKNEAELFVRKIDVCFDDRNGGRPSPEGSSIREKYS